MKQLVFLLAMLPLLSKAQDKNNPLDKKSDGEMQMVHAAKTYKAPAERKKDSPKKLKDNEVYLGDVQFTIGSNHIACDSAILYTNDNMLVASNVKVTNPESFDISGNTLMFNEDNNTAELMDNITVTAKNGDVVGTSTTLKFDFTYDIYRIVNGVITPPKRP